MAGVASGGRTFGGGRGFSSKPKVNDSWGSNGNYQQKSNSNGDDAWADPVDSGGSGDWNSGGGGGSGGGERGRGRGRGKLMQSNFCNLNLYLP